MAQHLALQCFLNVFPPWAPEPSAGIESRGRVTLTILFHIHSRTIKTDGKDVTSHLFIQQILFEPGSLGNKGPMGQIEREKTLPSCLPTWRCKTLIKYPRMCEMMHKGKFGGVRARKRTCPLRKRADEEIRGKVL